MQLDYASIMRGGQNLVPDIRQQLIEDALMKQQTTLFNQQQQDRAMQQQAAEEMQARQGEFQAALDDAMMTGDPRKIQQLRMRFPEFTKGMKEAFDAMDEDQRRADLTQVGSIYANLNAGNTGRAVELLRGRIEADRAAGQADPQDEQILAELESGDPMRVNAAKATVGIMLAAIEPDKFGETYGKLNPTEATPATIREYEARVDKFGKPAADAWLQTQDTKVMAVQAGGRLEQFGPDEAFYGGQQGGGDPASGVGAGQGSAPERLSLTRDQFKANLDALGPQRAIGLLNNSGIRVTVRSPQEARSLPSGTPIWLPDGTEGWAP